MHPYITTVYTNSPNYGASGQLFDFLGMVQQNEIINALPLRGYQLIYNEYYRDQNLVNEILISKGDGITAVDQSSDLLLQKRAWQKDYFTSALPWAQKGGEVTLPLVALPLLLLQLPG